MNAQWKALQWAFKQRPQMIDTNPITYTNIGWNKCRQHSGRVQLGIQRGIHLKKIRPQKKEDIFFGSVHSTCCKSFELVDRLHKYYFIIKDETLSLAFLQYGCSGQL